MLPMKQSKYSKLERGLIEPSFIELQQLTEVLDFSLDDVLQIKKPIPEYRPNYD